MTDVIEEAAKAMFGTVHGYHVDLNWNNASVGHRELYLKLARIAQPVFRDYYRGPDDKEEETDGRP